MIKFLKRKEKTKRENYLYEYKLYIRYDERTQTSIQQIITTTINWNELLNTQTLISDNEKDLSDLLKYNHLYILGKNLIRFIEKRDDIKVLIFDIAMIAINQQEPLKFHPSYKNEELVIDLDKTKKDEAELDIGKILSTNIVKGDIDV